jgi:Leucine-rich repeat (LRR) protein
MNTSPINILPIELLERILISARNDFNIILTCTVFRQIITERIKAKSKIIKLDLSGRKLESLPQDFFRHMTQLKELNLSFNKLKDLPPGIFRDLKSLKILNLSQNLFKTLSRRVFKGLRNLDTLNMWNTIGLSPAMFKELPRLRNIIISQHSKRSVPKSIRAVVANWHHDESGSMLTLDGMSVLNFLNKDLPFLSF